MKIFIALACFVAAAIAASGYPDVTPRAVPADKYVKTMKDLPSNAFYSAYVSKLTDNGYTILQIAKLTIAFFDSAAGEIDDIFPDQSFKLAIYQVVQVFTFPEQQTAQTAKVVHAYAAIAAWGIAEAQAAAIVELLLNLTNNVFHHYITYDQDLEKVLESTHPQIGSSSATGTDKVITEGAIRFVLGFARKAVKACYSDYREEIVEGTDAIILCEAFAYSTRGFPTDAKEAIHDRKKRDFFVNIIDKIAIEAKKDIKEFVHESSKGIGVYKTCIIAEAKAMNDGFFATMNSIHANLIPKSTASVTPLSVLPLPFDALEVPSTWAVISSK